MVLFVIQIPNNRNEIRLLYKFSSSKKDKAILDLDKLSLRFGGSVYTRIHKNNTLSWYWAAPYS